MPVVSHSALKDRARTLMVFPALAAHIGEALATLAAHADGSLDVEASCPAGDAPR